ncbi:calcium-binding protein [Pelomyxa schiedti]|nr:calcium-binding protein [Pelomyxa schiedti]
MGNAQGPTAAATAALNKAELEELLAHTHFGPSEIKSMYKQFQRETPHGVIGKAAFREVMKQMGVVDEFLQDLIFRVFDENRDGMINFREFACALSVMTRGNPDEKLEFAFQMYDLDGNGFISQDEMTKILQSFYKLVGPLVTFSGRKYDSPAQLVQEFFDQMDANHDGQISLEEYKEGALKNPDIIQGLKLFN